MNHEEGENLHEKMREQVAELDKLAPDIRGRLFSDLTEAMTTLGSESPLHRDILNLASLFAIHSARERSEDASG